MTCYFPESCQAARQRRSQPLLAEEPGAQALRLPPNPTALCLSGVGGIELHQTRPPTCPPTQPWREHPLGARCPWGESHVGPVGYSPRLADDESGAQRGDVTCLGPHSQQTFLSQDLTVRCPV